MGVVYIACIETYYHVGYVTLGSGSTESVSVRNRKSGTMHR